MRRVVVRPASLWAEAVFHVLAHVGAGALAASCHDRVYVAWAARRLGPADARALGEDARVLAAVARSHEVLAQAQAVAWVFDSAEQARAAADRDLARLAASDVASMDALAVARGAGSIAEVLRAAAELELSHVASLGSSRSGSDAIDRGAAAADGDPDRGGLRRGAAAADGDPDRGELEREAATVGAAIERVLVAAPSLAAHEVSLVRALGLRGRAFERSILVGVPGLSCPDAEHAAWQAAHEATVALVSRSGGAFDDVERRALGLLRSRARAAGLADAHGRWLARLDLRALGAIPDVDDLAE